MSWTDLGDLLHALIALPLLFGSFVGGALLQRRLPEAHRGPATHAMVRIVMDMLVTFAAIVLGLLITSAKTSFDATGDEVRTYAIDIITLDQTLASYGPDAGRLRPMLADYTRDVISRTDPDLGVASLRHFGLLSRIEAGMLLLPAATDMQHHIQDEAFGQLTRLQQERHRLADEAKTETNLTFYAMLMVWLMVVYGCFGLITERTWLGDLIVGLSVMAIVLAVFVILDMSTPFTGLVVVSEQPLRDALKTITAG
ncbi:hypothetical protein [Lichenicola sp.]|uniref:bestrophin-like domain n=1 Tax=Lichenicola sp. TaxID=2804529 RepID=UPI003B009D71